MSIEPASPAAVPASPSSFFVYILECSDGTYSVGHTHDLDQRLRAHNEGRGAHWTSARRPVRLAYSEPACDELSAIAREWQLKRWSAAKKRALASGQLVMLKRLSQCRTRVTRSVSRADPAPS
jgi:predicted GIY-YIG superfamily endonuclease